MSLTLWALLFLAVGLGILGILLVLGLCRSAAMDSDRLDEAEYWRRRS